MGKKRGLVFEELISAVEELDIESMLSLAKKTMGAQSVRFRVVNWSDEAVVPGWIIGGTLQEPEKHVPNLAKRVYYDRNETTRIDCLVGLVARVFKIREAESRRVSADKISTMKTYRDENNEIRKISPDLINSPGPIFNNIEDKNSDARRIFVAYKQRISEKERKYKSLTKAWNDFSVEIIKKTNSLKNAYRGSELAEHFHGLVFKVSEKFELDMRKNRWEELWHSLDEEKKQIDKFINAISKTGARYANLHKTLENYCIELDEATCELAIPVTASGRLLGILNFHRDEAFTQEDSKYAARFAALLALSYMRRQVQLLEDFNECVRAMTAESDIEKIAELIANYIRKCMFQIKPSEVYPLLYTCEPPIIFSDSLTDFSYRWNYQIRSTENDIDMRLLRNEKKLGKINIRSDGLGRSAIDKWRTNLGEECSSKLKSYFAVSGDVDNPNSEMGSKSSIIIEMNKPIRTTGCLPLIFDKKVFGLLYLHCTSSYFFKEFEFKALQFFALQAAIVIRNASALEVARSQPSYEEQFGKRLLWLALGYEEDYE